MKKRILALSLAGVMALGLAACGGGTEPSGNTTPATGGETGGEGGGSEAGTEPSGGAGHDGFLLKRLRVCPPTDRTEGPPLLPPNAGNPARSVGAT